MTESGVRLKRNRARASFETRAPSYSRSGARLTRTSGVLQRALPILILRVPGNLRRVSDKRPRRFGVVLQEPCEPRRDVTVRRVKYSVMIDAFLTNERFGRLNLSVRLLQVRPRDVFVLGSGNNQYGNRNVGRPEQIREPLSRRRGRESRGAAVKVFARLRRKRPKDRRAAERAAAKPYSAGVDSAKKTLDGSSFCVRRNAAVASVDAPLSGPESSFPITTIPRDAMRLKTAA